MNIYIENFKQQKSKRQVQARAQVSITKKITPVTKQWSTKKKKTISQFPIFISQNHLFSCFFRSLTTRHKSLLEMLPYVTYLHKSSKLQF